MRIIQGIFLTITLVAAGFPAAAKPLAEGETIAPGAARASATFDTGEQGWPREEGCFARGGTYHLLGGVSNGARALRGFEPTNRVVLAVDAVLLADPENRDGFGLDFRMQSPANGAGRPIDFGGLQITLPIPAGNLRPGYCFRITPHGHYYVNRVDGDGISRALVGSTASPAIRTGTGAVNRLEVGAWDGTMDFHVNGTRVARVYDPRYPAGELGFEVGQRQEVAFDNFTLAGAVSGTGDGLAPVTGPPARPATISAFEAAIRLAQEKKYREAIEKLDEALRQNPNHGEAWTWRGFIRYELGEEADAAADLWQALDRMGWRQARSPDAAALAHLCYRRLNSNSAARTMLDLAEKRCDRDTPSYNLIRYLRRELTPAALTARAATPAQQTASRAVIALDLSVAGKESEAQPWFDWLERNADRNSSWFLLKEKRVGEYTLP